MFKLTKDGFKLDLGQNILNQWCENHADTEFNSLIAAMKSGHYMQRYPCLPILNEECINVSVVVIQRF